MNSWLVKLIMPEGEWYQVVVAADTEDDAADIAYDYARSDGMEVDDMVVVLFEQGTHGDHSDYEILC